MQPFSTFSYKTGTGITTRRDRTGSSWLTTARGSATRLSILSTFSLHYTNVACELTSHRLDKHHFTLLSFPSIRKATFARLLLFTGGSLSEMLRLLTGNDLLHPILTENHFAALERRLLKTFSVIEFCREQHGNSIFKWIQEVTLSGEFYFSFVLFFCLNKIFDCFLEEKNCFGEIY